MVWITIAIDEQLLRAARATAVQRGTSVDKICGHAIEQFVHGAADVEARLARLSALAEQARRSKVASDTERLWPGRVAFYAGAPSP
jgi:hypothetical protein